MAVSYTHLSGAEGNRSAIPQLRSWKLNFRNVEFADSGFAVPAVIIGGSRTDAALSLSLIHIFWE